MFASHGEVKRKVRSRSASRARWGVTAAVGPLALLIVSVPGCRTAPLRDIVDASLPVACGEVNTDLVDEAIWRAGRKVGWTIERLRPGLLRGTWRFKHHEAVVSITHRNGRFSIRYEKSVNMLYQGDQIHRNYNRLVERLAAQIKKEPITPESGGRCPAAGAAAGTAWIPIQQGAREVP